MNDRKQNGSGLSERQAVQESGYRQAIAEMERLLDAQMKNIADIKSNAQIILGAASLIVALVSALQTFSPAVPSPAYTALAIVISVLYVIMVVCCIAALFLARVLQPVKADWDVFYEVYINQSDNIARYQQILSAQFNVFALNKPMISRRSWLVNAATLLLPVIVVLLFTLSLV